MTDGSTPLVEITDGPTRWRFDSAFLTSNWTCIWGRGCAGILEAPAQELGHGCCSLGAELDGGDEVRTIVALAACLTPSQFQNHAEAHTNGVVTESEPFNTRVINDACIFLNRNGFSGGAGCALHIAAQEAGEPTTDWKPSVCWQLPVKVDWADEPDGSETATVRAWNRNDWGEQGEVMAWCCTEVDSPIASAYVGEAPVIESLRAELVAIVGESVYDQLVRTMLDR
jgi:hypothetical protein